MKLLPVKLASLGGLACAVCSGLAQPAPTPAPAKPDDRVGRVIVSEPQAQAAGLKTTSDRQKLTDEVKERLARFEREREAYLRRLEELRKRLDGATSDAERQRIRDQLKSFHDAWQERTRQIREELKDRVTTVRGQMPSRQEVLDNAREKARDLSGSRKRRATD